MIVVGHGARFEMGAVLALAEALGAPVLTTFKAKGLVSDRHPARSRRARSQRHPGGELVDERVRPAAWCSARRSPTTPASRPYKPIVQVDFDPMALGRFHPVTVPVLGHAGVTAALLARPARRRTRGASTSAPTSRSAGDLAGGEGAAARRRPGWASSSAACSTRCPGSSPDDAVIAVDVGNHAVLVRPLLRVRRGQSVLMSGYLGSIGFGFPAAMGAWAAAPRLGPIFAVTGDGGFGQYLAELTTAVKYDMDITHVLLNNACSARSPRSSAPGDFAGVADRPAQPGLRRVRTALRRSRRPGDRPRPSRRRASRRDRAPRPLDGRGDHRSRAVVKRWVLVAVPQVLLLAGWALLS